MNIVPLEGNIQKRMREGTWILTYQKGLTHNKIHTATCRGLPSIFAMSSYGSNLIWSSFVKNHEKEVSILSISVLYQLDEYPVLI